MDDWEQKIEGTKSEFGMWNETKRCWKAGKLKAESSKSKIRKNQPEALIVQTNLTFLTIKTN
jgi:hypothetical protein